LFTVTKAVLVARHGRSVRLRPRECPFDSRVRLGEKFNGGEKVIDTLARLEPTDEKNGEASAGRSPARRRKCSSTVTQSDRRHFQSDAIDVDLVSLLHGLVHRCTDRVQDVGTGEE